MARRDNCAYSLRRAVAWAQEKKKRKKEIWGRCKGDGGQPSRSVEDGGGASFRMKNLLYSPAMASKPLVFIPFCNAAFLHPGPGTRKISKSLFFFITATGLDSISSFTFFFLNFFLAMRGQGRNLKGEITGKITFILD